ncbi:MAG: hypothetical protein RSE24_06735, partial [Oscillospiraceae bacterium]
MKKQKILLHTIVIFAIVSVLSLVLFFIKFSFLEAATTKTSGYFINDVFDAPGAPMKNNQPLSQDFSASTDIYGVKVRFHNLGVPQRGTLLVEISEKRSGKVVLSKLENSETLVNDGYSAINFESPYLSQGKEDFVLTLTPQLENPDGYLCVWQDTATKNMAFGVVDYIVSDFIYSWFNLLSVLIIAVAIGAYLVCFVFKLKKETAFVLCLCMVSVLFTLVLPPYSSPDE